jgi:Transposase
MSGSVGGQGKRSGPKDRTAPLAYPITSCSSPPRRSTKSAAPTGTSSARSAIRRPTKRFKDSRWSLLKKPEKLTDEQPTTLARIKAAGGEVWRAYERKEAVRGIFEPGLSSRTSRC